MEPIRSYSKEHQLRNNGKAAAVAAAVREASKHEYVTVKTQLKQTPLKPGKAMKTKGKRGKRLDKGDRAISEKFRAMRCLCGCRAKPDPAHLITRRNETTRHLEHLIIPLDRLRHDWLDGTDKGRACRKALLALAEQKGIPLTSAEFKTEAEKGGLEAWVKRQKGKG